MSRWLVGVFGGVLGFVLSQAIGMYQFSRNLKTTKEIETIQLARELSSEFYSDNEGDSLYREIRTVIESCDPVYKGNGGRFDHDEVNRYLDFFDNLGFYYRRGALDEETIDQFFGAFLVEAYEYEELQKYVSDLQKNSHESTAFAEFQALGKLLASRPDRIELASSFPTACRVQAQKNRQG